MSSSNCCFLTCIQISQEAGQVVWYSHLLQNFPVYCDPHSQRLWHSQQSRNRWFFWNSLAFLMIQQMLAIWSLVLLSFPTPPWTSGSSHFTYCWSLAWRILSITLLPCEMSVIVWYFEHPLALPFFGIGIKTDLTAGIGYGTVSVLIFSCENSKITTRCWTTIERRMLDPIRKRYPHPRAKEKPQQDGKRS